MLIVRRKDFSGLPGGRPPEDERLALRLEVELEPERGDFREGLGLDGVRSLEGPYGEAALGVSGAVFLGFGLGRGGNDPDGGLDREGCGKVEVEAMTTETSELNAGGLVGSQRDGHAGEVERSVISRN